jgi:hypothetical protein
MRNKVARKLRDDYIEKISVYSFFERVKYWRNNNYFTGFRIPSNLDIHIHNIWKDTIR